MNVIWIQTLYHFNPLSTTGLLTPVLIGSYHEMFTWVANYDRALKNVHHKLANESIFLIPSLIGSINDRIFILTNWLVVLMGLKLGIWISKCVKSHKLIMGKLYECFVVQGYIPSACCDKCLWTHFYMWLVLVCNIHNVSWGCGNYILKQFISIMRHKSQFWL